MRHYVCFIALEKIHLTWVAGGEQETHLLFAGKRRRKKCYIERESESLGVCVYIKSMRERKKQMLRVCVGKRSERESSLCFSFKT